MSSLLSSSFASCLSFTINRNLSSQRRRLLLCSPTAYLSSGGHQTGSSGYSWHNNGCVCSNRRTMSSVALAKHPVTVFTDDQTMLKDSVRRYAEEEIQPLVQRMDEEGKLDPGVLHSLFQQGYMGIEVDPVYGGSGMTFTDCLIVIEQIARVDPAVAVVVDIHNTLINRCLAMYGTEEQKDAYLPRCAQDMVGSFCLSESGSGSDAFALQARATRTEGGWTITGSKQWISNSLEAGLFIIFATIAPELRHKGITAFLVDAGTDGLEIGGKYDKLGIRASSTCEVILNEVFVSDSRVLGEVGKGYKVAIEGLNEGRIGIAAQMLGLAEGAFSAAMAYINDRKQFNTRIADFQGVRFQYARLSAHIESVRCLVYNAAALKEAGHDFTREAAIAKLLASTTAEKVASECLELFGGYGFTKEYPAEKFYRDAKIGSIYEGTSNIQLETIAKIIQKEYNK
eukprot:GHVS01108928.1.p1 GENE.GHVS01108928.1~~GHVS01108928.1.p1  ORF type:complete len:455 (+),score=54.89 GHVS01108928.1:61-1425(+)